MVGFWPAEYVLAYQDYKFNSMFKQSAFNCVRILPNNQIKEKFEWLKTNLFYTPFNPFPSGTFYFVFLNSHPLKETEIIDDIIIVSLKSVDLSPYPKGGLNNVFFLKLGQIGEIVQASKSDYSFKVSKPYNDSLSGSLIHQIKVALKNSRVEPIDKRYINALGLALTIHLVQIQLTNSNDLGKDEVKLSHYKINKLKDFILFNLDRKILINELAQEVKLSEGYLYKALKDTTGLTPYEFITHLKIERAKKLLVQNELSIIQIGLSIGFDSSSGFSKLFKKQIGVSPSFFQKVYSK